MFYAYWNYTVFALWKQKSHFWKKMYFCWNKVRSVILLFHIKPGFWKTKVNNFFNVISHRSKRNYNRIPDKVRASHKFSEKTTCPIAGLFAKIGLSNLGQSAVPMGRWDTDNTLY